MCIYTKKPEHENVIRLFRRNLGSKRSKNSNWTRFVYNWFEAVYFKQVVHPELLVPRFKIIHS